MPEAVRVVKTLPTRMFKEHERRCGARKHARNGDWDTAWAYIVDSSARRHPVTNKRLRYIYVIWRCNDTECPALIGVRLEHLERLLPSW